MAASTVDAVAIEKFLTIFKWDTLREMCGCAHNSIIGFLSTTWINQMKGNSVLDGAPSPKTGEGRRGQKNADILFCRLANPLIVVEVETVVGKYRDKLESIKAYFDNNTDYEGLQIGLLVMTNLCTGDRKYKHNWETIKREVRQANRNIALVSIEKENHRKELDNSVLGRLKKRNDYYPWQIENIDYWVHSASGVIREGRLI